MYDVFDGSPTMMPRVPKLIRILYHLPNFVRLFTRLWHDPRVPIYRKAIPILSGAVGLLIALIYLAMPYDFDFLPVIGRLDDLFVLAALLFAPGAWLFIRLCPPDVVAEHIEAIDEELHR